MTAPDGHGPIFLDYGTTYFQLYLILVNITYLNIYFKLGVLLLIAVDMIICIFHMQYCTVTLK